MARSCNNRGSLYVLCYKRGYVEIAFYLLAGCLLVYLASRSQGRSMPPPPYQPRSTSTETDADAVPVINYTLLVADPRSGQWLQIEAPADYLDHYGILEGQYVQVQWQVLHADFIHIEGIGYVPAVGSKDLFPKQATRYRIQARNRHHNTEQEIVVHVFPIPAMEYLLTPLPDLNARTELTIDPLPVADQPRYLDYPRIQAPGLLPLQEELQPAAPKPILPAWSIHKSSLNNKSFKKLTNSILNKFNTTPGPAKDPKQP